MMPGTDERDLRSAVERAVVKAEADPLRPTYHFRAPAQWMNDPNGTIFRNGAVEIFYQFNPFADTFGKMHWGHTRTLDYVTWEHHPVALVPRHTWREAECWSGCCAISSIEGPVIFYTSIEGVSGGPVPNTIRIAKGSDDFLTWNQEELAVLQTADIPESIRNDWRDPYLFTANGDHYMVVGAVVEGEHEQPAVLLFRARDDALRKWEYLGHLYDADDECPFPECPNFFQLGDRWVLIVSGFRPVEYHVGAFSAESAKFTVDTSGIVDHSSEFYATNTIVDDQGRTVLFAWIRGFPKGRGWNGCLALPRTLHLASDGALLQAPIQETEQLRRHRFVVPQQRLGAERILVDQASVHNMELQIRFTLPKDTSLEFDFSSEDESLFRITIDHEVLRVGGITIPLDEALGDKHSVRLFTDRSVVELFADDGRYCATRVVESLVSCSRLVVRKRGAVEIEEIVYWSMGELKFVNRW